MFEGYYSPPLYQDLYNFVDGAQNDIFVDSVVTTPLPSSSPVDQSSSSHAPTIVDAKATPVPTTSPSSSPSPSSASAYQSPPNEMNPSPAHTSEPNPSQSDSGNDHKHTGNHTSPSTCGSSYS